MISLILVRSKNPMRMSLVVASRLATEHNRLRLHVINRAIRLLNARTFPVIWTLTEPQEVNQKLVSC
jgi:hypothetical protein